MRLKIPKIREMVSCMCGSLVLVRSIVTLGKLSCAYFQFSFAFNIRGSAFIPGDKFAAQFIKFVRSFRSNGMSVLMMELSDRCRRFCKGHCKPHNQALSARGTDLVSQRATVAVQ